MISWLRKMRALYHRDQIHARLLLGSSWCPPCLVGSDLTKSRTYYGAVDFEASCRRSRSALQQEGGTAVQDFGGHQIDAGAYLVPDVADGDWLGQFLPIDKCELERSNRQETISWAKRRSLRSLLALARRLIFCNAVAHWLASGCCRLRIFSVSWDFSHS